MRFPVIIIALFLTVIHAQAQNEPLVADPGKDQFEFCKALYRQANAQRDHTSRVLSYQRLAPRLDAYIKRFPNHTHTPAAMYYLGECYYQSGSINDAKRVLMGVVNRFGKGRYVALASNRMAYDAFHNKKYAQAAVHFKRVARFADTPEERYRGRYQEASCYRFAGNTDAAIRAYTEVEVAKNAAPVYRENAKLRLGHLYLTKKNLSKAKEKFTALILPAVGEKLRIEATFQSGLIALEEKDNKL